LADSVAAALARRADSAQKPSGYVRRALEERGKTLEDVEKEIERELPKVYGIVKEVSKDTGLSTCSSCSTSKAYP